MTRRSARAGRPVRLAGALCLTFGALLLLEAGTERSRGIAWQEARAEALRERRAGAGPAGGERVPALRRGDAVGRLRIARIGLDAVVVEGTDPEALKLGPGHMVGTALPGEPDNCIIAGHRDGHFARLGSVRPGDIVELHDAARRVRYAITSITVVDQEDNSELAPADRPILTLITCYPFRYVGPAPKRFVVRGELLGGDALIAGPPRATARTHCSSR